MRTNNVHLDQEQERFVGEIEERIQSKIEVSESL